PYLLKLLLSNVADGKALAEKALSQMSLRGTPTEIIVQTYAKSDRAAKIILVGFLGNRAIKDSVSFFLKASEEGDAKLRKTALKALKNTCLAGDTAKLLEALSKITKKSEAKYIQSALVRAFKGQQTSSHLDKLVVASASMKGKQLEVVLNTLASVGTIKAVGAVRNAAKDSVSLKTAIKALSGNSSLIAAQSLLDLLVKGKGSTRVLGVRGLLQVLERLELDNNVKAKLLNRALKYSSSGLEKTKLKMALNLCADNLAFGKKVHSDFLLKGKASIVVDGVLGRNRHVRLGGDRPSVSVDLGKLTSINGVQTFFYTDARRKYSYNVEVSVDAKNWKKIVDNTNPLNPSSEKGLHHYFDKVKARYVRLSNLKNSSNSEIHLVEFKVFSSK
ncbi:MAG: discoidin domain-containing protein, partial [Lentisphaeraceae bacterium]|nr:discoidin domain-containing protein [Lentisphaeraceae bacterium]